MTDYVVNDYAEIARQMRIIKSGGEEPVCSTCNGIGRVDTGLGGEPTSGWVDCPDCNAAGAR